MRFILPKLLVLSFFTFTVTTVSAQNDKSKKLADFDEKHIIECAKKDKIPAQDIPAYVAKMKQRHAEMEQAMKHPFDPYLFTPNTASHKTQSTYCPNAGFDQNNFTNWTGGYYYNSSSSYWPTLPWTGASTWSTISAGAINAGPGVTNAHQTIMTTPPGTNASPWAPASGWDPHAINASGKSDIPVVNPNGGGVSMRLGKDDAGGEAERISYTMAVTPNNTQFNYSFAVVLNDGGHLHNESPFFNIIAVDQTTGDTVGGSCGKYGITADPSTLSSDTSFKTSSIDNTVHYKKWTNVTIDLSTHVGNTVVIEFQVGDCCYTAHYGYAYIDAECGVLQGTSAGFCFGSSSAVLNAPTGFVNYQWQGPNNTTNIAGATNSSLNVVGPVLGDIYTVVMTTAAGCNTTLAITLQQSVVTSTFTSANTCVGGNFGSAVANPSGGLPGSYLYNWTTGPNQTGTSVGNTATLNNLVPGTYYLHISSNTCAPYEDSIKIIGIPPVPTPSSVSYCGSQIALTSAGGNSQYQWYDTAGVAIAGPLGTSQNYTAQAPNGSSVFAVAYQNAVSGCRDSSRITVNNNSPIFFPQVTPPCGGGSNGSIVFNIGGGGNYQPYSNTWTSSIPSSGSGVNLGITNLANGTYTVTIFSTANPSCAVTQVVPVNQNSIPVNKDTVEVCNYAIQSVGPPAGLGVPGPTFHKWDYLNATSATINLPIPTTNFQTFTDTLTYSANCKTVYKVTVRHHELEVDLGPNEVNHCYNDSAGLITANIVPNVQQGGFTGATPYNYIWTGGYFHQHNGVSTYSHNTLNTTSSNDMLTNLYSGTYSVTITSADGCKKDTTFTVSEPPKPQPILDIKAWFCHRDTIGYLVAPLGNGSYQWYAVTNGLADTTKLTGFNDDTLVIADPENTYMNYYVTYIYYANGCLMTTNVKTPLTPPPPFTPDITVNVFSPNGDNKNDKFLPFFHPQLSQASINYYGDEFTLKIYDRWGKFVYESNSYLPGWDGKRDGKDVDDGNYFWIATYKPRCGNNGDVVTKQGFVQVLH